MNSFMKDVEKDMKKNSILESKAFEPKFRESAEKNSTIIEKRLKNVLPEESSEESVRLQHTLSDLSNGNMEQGDLMDSLNDTNDSSY